MKKILIILSIVGISAINASEIKNEFERQYISSCVFGSVTKNNNPPKMSSLYCICQWQQLENKVTEDFLIKADGGSKKELDEFKKLLENTHTYCVSLANK